MKNHPYSHWQSKIGFTLVFLAVLTVAVLRENISSPALASSAYTPAVDDPSPPAAPVKLIFIHHSCGENWLNDSDGGLGIALRDNNYFVSDTNYGWEVGGTDIGSLTDIGNWWDWFRGANSAAYTAALYTEYGQNSSYSRLSTDPGGQNEIIVFKSCYPNSHLGGNPGDPPTTGANPLRGQDAYDDSIHTVANAKGIYNDILEYFGTRQDKLFIVVTAPALQDSDTDAAHAANARAFNDWLVNDWLNGYAHDNVAVFDFYNVLTSNGGDPDTNDLGQTGGNHHRWWSGAVQHVHPGGSNYSAYQGGNGGGSHPTTAGNLKATGEFIQLLNVFYNRWQDGTSPDPSLTLTSPNGGEDWTVGSQHQIQWTTSGTVTQVSLAYSTDNFATSQVIAASIANNGSYNWSVPDDPSTTVRVRVSSAAAPAAVYDDSNANFTITSGGSETYTFNAIIAPANATTPVTYQWSPEPASGQGTASAAYQWSGGTNEISVTVTNCGGTFSDTHIIPTVSLGDIIPAASLGDIIPTVSLGDTIPVGRAQSVGQGQPAPHQAASTTVVFQHGVSPDAGYNGASDVIIARDADANANLGGMENLEVFFGDEENRSSLMRWDISALPSDITIESATVELYHSENGASNDMLVELYRVTGAWVEGTGYEINPGVGYTPDGATWATSDGSTPWTTPGGDYAATALDQITLADDLGDGWISLDATAAVQAWVAGSAPNYGLLLRSLSGEYTYHYFHSREAATANLRPRLVVTYTTGTPTPTHAIYLPLVLNTSDSPACAVPLTGVTINEAVTTFNTTR